MKMFHRYFTVALFASALAAGTTGVNAQAAGGPNAGSEECNEANTGSISATANVGVRGEADVVTPNMDEASSQPDVAAAADNETTAGTPATPGAGIEDDEHADAAGSPQEVLPSEDQAAADCVPTSN
jgi:hypothetical protein